MWSALVGVYQSVYYKQRLPSCTVFMEGSSNRDFEGLLCGRKSGIKIGYIKFGF